jgi:hypothetical protein
MYGLGPVCRSSLRALQLPGLNLIREPNEMRYGHVQRQEHARLYHHIVNAIQQVLFINCPEETKVRQTKVSLSSTHHTPYI